MLENIESFIVDEAWPGLGDFIKDNGFQIGLILVLTYVARKFAMVFVAKFIRKAIPSEKFATAHDELQREDTLIQIARTPIRLLLWAVSAMLLLGIFGIDTAPIIAGASIIGVALGFGAQSLVKDVISGIFILLENQYRVGDVVELNKTVWGTVENFSLRETVLRDLDGMVHHMPNGEITIATNMTMDYGNVNFDMGVGYGADIEKVEKIVNKVGLSIQEDEQWLEFIIEPPAFLRVEDFADSAVVIKILGKTQPMKNWAVTGELRKRLKIAFDKEGIEIPFPQRVVHQATAPKKKSS